MQQVRPALRRLAALLLALPLAACASIDYDNPPPADYPKLRVEVVHHQDVAPACALLGVYAGPGERLWGCATADYGAGTCTIHVERDPPAWVMQHEYAHCRGYDHPGADTFRKGWERWKRRNGRT